MFPSQTSPTRVMHFNRGYGYAASGVSGVIAAGLAQDSIILALACDPQSQIQAASKRVGLYFDRLHVAFTTIAAFTTPITSGRRLALYRATSGTTNGGNALAVSKKDGVNAPASVCTTAVIAGTTGIAGLTRETAPIGTMDLVHVGAAGARQDFVFELGAPANAPISIAAGQSLVVSNPVVMDAGGTWQLTLKEAHWIEALREEAMAP